MRIILKLTVDKTRVKQEHTPRPHPPHHYPLTPNPFRVEETPALQVELMHARLHFTATEVGQSFRAAPATPAKATPKVAKTA